MGGVVYMSNVAGALAQLPSSRRPELHLIHDGSGDPGQLEDAGGRFVSEETFNVRGETTLRSLVQNVVRARQPRTLAAAAAATGAEVLFPTQGPLGREFPIPWVGWVPDLQHRRHPEFFPDSVRRFRDERVATLLDEADQVVVSSENSLHDLGRYFEYERSRVSVLRLSCVPPDSWWEGDPQKTAEAMGLPARYIMLPSQFWVHKNHRIAFEAMKLLASEGLSDVHLVCTGYGGDYRWPRHYERLVEYLGANALTESVHLLGLLPRSDQVQLMRASTAVIQPALSEGWSAVVEDARALGKRVYLSDLDVHREQSGAGLEARFFPAMDARRLAELIAEDWAELQPGPDPAREAEARRETPARVSAFALDILEVLNRAREARS